MFATAITKLAITPSWLDLAGADRAVAVAVFGQVMHEGLCCCSTQRQHLHW